jgi:mRNA interferase MazF
VPNTPEPRAGEIWDVNFNPQVGREQAGIRPALVISTDQFNEVRNGLFIVTPITGTDRGLTYHVSISPPEGGLTKPSVIMCEQERSQSSKRFLRRRGRVSDESLQHVRRIVGALIDR